MALINKLKTSLKVFIPQRKTVNKALTLTESENNLQGKTIVFTGGTDGIGKTAVEMLCDMGANVILLARTQAKAQAVIDEINVRGKGQAVFQMCDLASLDSVKLASESILAKHSKINILINNAGVNMLTENVVTKDGIEMTWSTNYFAPVLLTRLLQPVITERIINLTTETSYIDELDINYVQSCDNFNSKDRYFESKLAINMFTIDLANELQSKGITVHAMLPGYIKSNLLRNLKGATKVMQSLMNVMASPTVVGSDRIVRLAAGERFGIETGLYQSEDKILPFHKDAQNAEKRKKLAEFTQNVLAKWL